MLNATPLLLALAPQSFEWNETAQLTASDAAVDDEFGFALAIEGDRHVVGARLDDDLGAAYVFLRSGTAWAEEAKLVASDAELEDEFGRAVAISGDTVLVGAPEEDEPGFDSGAAYVFRRTGRVWTEEAKLEASDGVWGDRLGWSVAVSGDTALVGSKGVDTFGTSSGAAYVFQRSGTTWSEQVKLEASDAEQEARFGYSVALEGDTALIGAFKDGAGFFLSWRGAAYVFQRSGTAWSQEYKLTASDGQTADRFGASVALHGNTALVGAPFDDNQFDQNAGSAYVFVRSGTAWNETAKLVASDPDPGDEFGHSVALYNGSAMVGAHQDSEVANRAGAAYAFRRSGTSWTEESKLTNATAGTMDMLGQSVAMSGQTALVAAHLDDTAADDAGAVFVHESTLLSVGEIYCTSGTSASGCHALISASGTPSASAPSGFVLTAIDVEGAKDGLFFYGTNGRQANPWFNGGSYVCVIPPRLRGGLLTAVGSTAGQCDGTLSQDLNARWTAAPNHNPGSGAVMQAQLWYRDPNNPSFATSSMSDAVEFTVQP